MDRESKDATAIFSTQFLLNFVGVMVAQRQWSGDVLKEMIHEAVRQTSERNPDEFDALHEVGQMFLDRIAMAEEVLDSDG